MVMVKGEQNHQKTIDANDSRGKKTLYHISPIIICVQQSVNGAFQRTQTWSINEYGEEAYMWLTRIYLIDKDFLIFYFYFEGFDFLIWWYDLKRNIIWKAIKDNLSLKRISCCFILPCVYFTIKSPILAVKRPNSTQSNY